MSAVRDYHRDHRSWDDDLHKLLDREPGLLAQLPPLRARALGCCGAVAGKGGVIDLVVADPAGWDAIAKEQAAVQGKLDAISRAVAEIDAIFAEIDAAGLDRPHKTLAEIVGVEMSKRTIAPPQAGEYINVHGIRVDRLGIPIKMLHDPQALAWVERAGAAVTEAQAALSA